MNILGINWGAHDSAAALVQDDRVIAAAEEERFNRIKHAPYAYPLRAAHYCLREAGLRVEDLDEIAFSFRPTLQLGASIAHTVRFFPRGAFTTLAELVRRIWYAGSASYSEYFLHLTHQTQRFWIPHHTAHAASAYFAAPFDQAAILVIDGMGEWPVTTAFRARGPRLERLRQVSYPHSIGFLYSAFTEYLGFEPFDAEYKVMGLAAYGDPSRYRQQLREIVQLQADGRYRLDLSYFNFQYDYGRSTWYNPRRMTETFGPPWPREELPDQRCADIAAALQERTEEMIFHLADWLHAATGMDDLCLAGGVALNSVANGKLLRRGPFRRIYIQGAANDAGCALGTALYRAHAVHGRPWEELRHLFYGPGYTAAEVETALKATHMPYRRIEDPAETAARLLVENKIVGWYQGRMEFGPRALGNRSILGDPRREDMKDRINAAIKFREPFRPFAPSVLAEHAAEFFTDIAESPFMILVTDVRPEKRAVVPAITHVDGSGRLHTVERAVNPCYWQLIARFGELTGVPLVLNTSFNVRGQPIVNTPTEALATFYTSGLDALVIDHFLVEK
ncbi:MAG TPA: carbamoyltransferase C-terminal domain-containing protein [Anaerolineae bacterium]|nr:carbamoyltransferase C-terminal domain-containing protein [Anaerolineae bacterium]